MTAVPAMCQAQRGVCTRDWPMTMTCNTCCARSHTGGRNLEPSLVGAERGPDAQHGLLNVQNSSPDVGDKLADANGRQEGYYYSLAGSCSSAAPRLAARRPVLLCFAGFAAVFCWLSCPPYGAGYAARAWQASPLTPWLKLLAAHWPQVLDNPD